MYWFTDGVQLTNAATTASAWFSYDGAGRTWKHGFGNGDMVTRNYDAQSRRISKVVSNWSGSGWSLVSSNRFLYDGWNPVAILDSQSSLLQSSTWGLDLSGSLQGAGGVGGLLWLASQSSPLTRHFAAYDGNGNVMALVNAADGTISAQYEYGPFGEAIRATGLMAKANPFRFSTKCQDEETDLKYYGYRFYSQSVGMWLNRDPIGTAGGLNLYGFVGNEPIDRVDERGLFWPFSRKKPCCCCCAEDIQIKNIEPVQRGWLFGHAFDVPITLKFVVSSVVGDCRLQWLEKTNDPYTDRMPRNQWTDMTLDPQTRDLLIPWNTRKKRCPSTEPVPEWDEAMYQKFRHKPRTIEYHIIVSSTPGCPCAKAKVEVTAEQTLDPTEAPPIQEFVTPAPWVLDR